MALRNRRIEWSLMNDMPDNSPTFSFVIPVYNEQEGVEEFFGRLRGVADELKESYEIIFIDDGSQDRTGEILRRLATDDVRVKVVEFSRNFGHQMAVTAGYDHATGQAVISLDADCQHPPEIIPELVARWREGFEVVYTVRKYTDGISRLRRMVGRCVYRLIAAISGVDLTDQADFRLLDRKAVNAIKAHREHARFVRGLVRWIGFRQTSLEYVAQKRSAGKSNYSMRQLGGMAGTGVFNFSLRPLRVAVTLGLTLIIAAVLYVIGSLVLWGFGITAGRLTHLMMFVVAMSGLQFLLLGIIGEYVGRTFEEAKARPLYIVREKVGFPLQQEQKPPPPEAAEQETQRFSVFT